MVTTHAACLGLGVLKALLVGWYLGLGTSREMDVDLGWSLVPPGTAWAWMLFPPAA